jgi:uncharacterized protein DUF4265
LGKVSIPLNPEEWHGYSAEQLWAEREAGGRYRLANVPFYACGYSFDDIVIVQEEEVPRVVSLYKPSGHSTYRLFVAEELAGEGEGFHDAWAPLRALGCTYERATKRLIGVDVPPSSDIAMVYRELEGGERSGAWDFEEGACRRRTS